MITTGSRFFYGMALVGWVAALTYGIITNGIDQGGVINNLTGDGAVDTLLGPLTLGYKGGVGDHVGFSILMGFALAALGMGLACTLFRDGDASSLAELPGADPAQPIAAPASLNVWPAVLALAAALVIVGLATSPVVFVIGCVVAAIAGIEWTISTWADSISADPATNAAVRNRLMLPIEIPVAAVLLIGAIVLAFSRIFLAVSKLGAVWVALAIATVIFVGAVIFNAQTQMRRSLVVGGIIVLAVIILGVGIGGAIAGERKFEKHGSGDHSSEGAWSRFGSPTGGERD